jgi:cell division cycle protein 20 (cofactor of APC complex)
MKANLFGETADRILPIRGTPEQEHVGFARERGALKKLPLEPTARRSIAQTGIRNVPQTPDRILDAPDLRCDFYLNLLDWSTKNMIAVALGETVYLWNASNGSIDTLCTHNEQGSYVSSLSWSQNGKHLAIGTGNNKVQLWDVETKRKDRTLFSAGSGADSRVAALGWSPSGALSSGSRGGTIWHHDPRAQRHHISTMQGHTQEVCGLKWSPDGKYLASGGNDNLVNIYQPDGYGACRVLTDYGVCGLEDPLFCPIFGLLV